LEDEGEAAARAKARADKENKTITREKAELKEQLKKLEASQSTQKTSAIGGNGQD